MENFIYSVDATFPIFLVMVIGYILKQIGMLNDNFVTVANRFNFKVTLPFMLFRDISGVDIRAVFDIRYVLFCALVSTACFWIIWGGVKLFLKDQSMRGAFVQASFRSSAAVMGLAFIQNMYGSSAMGPLMIVSAVPLYNIFSVIVLTFEGAHSGEVDPKQKVKDACINIAKNPIILGILAGLVVGLLGIDFPVFYLDPDARLELICLLDEIGGLPVVKTGLTFDNGLLHVHRRHSLYILSLIHI